MKNKKVSIAKENTILGKFFYFVLKVFVAPIVKLIWIKKIDGMKNIPAEGPFIVVANHQSYFDFITIVSILPLRIRFLAAEKFFSSKFWKPIMEYTGQIKVERQASNKNESTEKALQILHSGAVLGIFPQGTRSRNGNIEKTFTGVARLALEAKVPVLPIGIKGAFQVMPPSADKPKFKKIIEINIGEAIDLSEYYKLEKDKTLHRKITNEIMTRVSKLSDKEYNNE